MLIAIINSLKPQNVSGLTHQRWFIAGHVLVDRNKGGGEWRKPTHSYLPWPRSDTTIFAHVPLARTSHMTLLDTGGVVNTVWPCSQEEETGLVSTEPVARNNYMRNSQKAAQICWSSIVSHISDNNILENRDSVWTTFLLALESVPHLLTLIHRIKSVQNSTAFIQIWILLLASCARLYILLVPQFSHL